MSQYGQSQGTHITHSTESNYRGDPVNVGRGYQNPVGPTSFNNIGPGKGRTVYSSGSQGVQGSVNPGNAPAKNTDILSQFGPDYRKP